VSVAPALLPKPAYALPEDSVYIEYYSDNTFTTQVGWKFISCSGQTTRSGIVTQYTIVDSEPC
jgi:hypothetical protein